MNRLPIYYEGQEVAGLILNQHGFLELEYTKAWQLHGFDISVSLPRFHLKHTGYEVRAFFENMLPEGRIRESLARQYGTNPENIFGILKHVGQDCAGAFSIGGPGTQGHYAALSTGQIQELLNKLPDSRWLPANGRPVCHSPEHSKNYRFFITRASTIFLSREPRAIAFSNSPLMGSRTALKTSISAWNWLAA